MPVASQLPRVAPTDETALWSAPVPTLLAELGATDQGLSQREAARRLRAGAAGRLRAQPRAQILGLLARQFTSPLVLLLAAAAVVSFFLGDAADAIIILIIVLVSGLLGFWQEHAAASAVEKLLAAVRITAEVLRDGKSREISTAEVVAGDLVLFNAGDIIPGDCRILESRDLFADEASLTGETYPAEKLAGDLPADTPLSHRTNVLHMGTHVVSGTARAVAVRTGKETEYGRIADRLRLRPPETDFERGVRRFGYFFSELTLLLVLVIFAANVFLAKPVLDSFQFALALAVGLTPQLLPAIISVNLAYGARRMVSEKVLVKRLAAIEDFGSMDVLCSDKTGTLTTGSVTVAQALDAEGEQSPRVQLHAYLNAALERGFANPIDQALRAIRTDITGYRKLDEVPYDFVRRRLSILVQHGHERFTITKGALASVLDVCDQVETPAGLKPMAEARPTLETRFAALNNQGLRLIGVARKDQLDREVISRTDEMAMTFLGVVAFADPPKEGIAATLAKLRDAGVALKIITGDSSLVARALSDAIGLGDVWLLSGREVALLSEDALVRQVSGINIFAEVEPSQKERIILALRRAGHVVGYLGDGINDASALHAAHVGISVDSAVDVAKDAADIVLMEKDLAVLVDGVRAGRVTFANALKYVFMASSANFGNMASMAVASLFLPFLPLLPTQILLLNLLTDMPEMTIASDKVDAERLRLPRRWDITMIRRFMVIFGPLSSVFDVLTFLALLFIFGATPDQFRTGWFLESIVSAAMVVLVLRTRRPFFRSLPARPLLLATLTVVAVGLMLPYSPLGPIFAFTPLGPQYLACIVLIVAAYVTVAEVTKILFYRRASS